MRTHPGMRFSMCQAGNTCLNLLFVFIDASQTVCKVTCLLFVEIDEFDVSDTDNMHCARSLDAQDDRICSYRMQKFYETGHIKHLHQQANNRISASCDKS